ncbi:MAG TPA: lysylphosphatidylglycerol synthase transmembrane domain-containing protein [Polyangiaceae bacterium]|nr:lysylphosphatidylglycerol synthase transmembrane domain-containing protein [Polyangiaceae bacterium]
MTEPAAAPRNSRASIVSKLVVSLLPAGLFVWILQSGSLPIVPPRAELARVASWTIPTYVAVWAVMYFVRLARWYWLLKPVQKVPLATVLRAGGVGMFFIALAPFRMGEVARPLLIRRPPKLTFWAASGTVGGERVLDALAVSILLLSALHFSTPLDPLPHHLGTLPLDVAIVPRMATVSSLVFATAGAVMALFYFQRAFARRLTELVLGVFSKKLAAWVAHKIEQMADGLSFLREPANAVPFVIATIVYWLLNATTWWLLAQGCGLEQVGFWAASATMGVTALGILVPATPGFFGAFQFATFAGLAMYLAPDAVMSRGAVYAFLGYLLPISLTALVGIGCMLAKPRALLLLAGGEDAAGVPVVPTENLAGPPTVS